MADEDNGLPRRLSRVTIRVPDWNRGDPGRPCGHVPVIEAHALARLDALDPDHARPETKHRTNVHFEIEPTAKRFENWEQYIAGHIALGVAVDYALEWGIDAIRERVTSLADRLRAALASLPGVVVRDLGREKCGIVTFTADALDPLVIRDRLRAQRINVSVTSRSSTRLDMEARGLHSMVRASVHYYSTDDEIERLVAAVKSLTPTS